MIDRLQDDFAVLTSAFTLRSHPRRQHNYAVFRACLGRPVLVAEIAFGESFWPEIASREAVRFKGDQRHVLWQKERLLNILLDRLPPDVRYVAWLDGDIVFSNPNWIAEARRMLNDHPVVQLFDQVDYLGVDGETFEIMAGVVAKSVSEKPPAPFSDRLPSGFAWAARREVLSDLRFLDFLPTGGGDRYMACGFQGHFSTEVIERLPTATLDAVYRWADRAYAVTRGRVGYVPGTVKHLFHGEPKTRRYETRYEMLRAARFDPENDIAVDNNGLYAWSSPKPSLHRDVYEYLDQRCADENEGRAVAPELPVRMSV